MKRSRSGETQLKPDGIDNSSSPWNGFHIYIFPKKISAVQRKLVTESCRRQGLRIAETTSGEVTHVVTSLEPDRIVNELQGSPISAAEILTLTWLTSSLTAGRPLANDAFRDLTCPSKKAAEDDSDATQTGSQDFEDTNYACLSATPLKAVHPANQKFVDALLSLEKTREILDYNSEARGSRSLAFRRAACKLKIFPKQITSTKQVASLDAIGRHSVQVVDEILSQGYSKEVKDFESDARLQVLQVFSSVYGCGPASAAKWYAAGARSIEDVRGGAVVPSDRQKIGLEYHDYLQVPVSLEEAEALRNLIEEEVQRLSSGMTATLAGGFRRGKPSGHDIDVLLHHPTDGYEPDFLQALIEKLRYKGLLVHSELSIGKNNHSQLEKSVSSHYHRDTTFYQRTQKMDHLDKAYCMLDITDKVLQQYMKAPSPSQQDQTSTGSSTRQEAAATESEQPPTATLGTSAAASLADSGASSHDLQATAAPGSTADTMRWWTKRDHFVRRVDLIVCPHKQWAYALVGWTGSKYFNRALRLYAVREKKTILNSQTMYNQETQEFIPAETEEDVFDGLGVPVYPPHLRNC